MCMLVCVTTSTPMEHMLLHFLPDSVINSNIHTRSSLPICYFLDAFFCFQITFSRFFSCPSLLQLIALLDIRDPKGRYTYAHLFGIELRYMFLLKAENCNFIPFSAATAIHSPSTFLLYFFIRFLFAFLSFFMFSESM